eukprot:11631593-Alexandrium_andersonii.AAC.1
MACPLERPLTSEVLEAGLQTWQGRLRPGEAVAIAVAAGGRLLLKGPGEHTCVTLSQASWLSVRVPMEAELAAAREE